MSHMRSSFTHSMTVQLRWVIPGCCDRGGTVRDEDWIEVVCGRSEEPSSVFETLAGASWTLGSTQCSNIRMFIMGKKRVEEAKVLNVIERGTAEEDPQTAKD